ncbi:MAG: hypothetical protein HY335_10905 [Deinococcus sp.]|nr:hypothetical protein [Deinococcus sp.]
MSHYQHYGTTVREKMAAYQAEAARARLLKLIVPSFRVRLGRILLAMGRRLVGESPGLQS